MLLSDQRCSFLPGESLIHPASAIRVNCIGIGSGSVSGISSDNDNTVRNRNMPDGIGGKNG